MNRFALPEFTPVTVEHVNLRPENHGDDAVPAIDIKLSKELSNTVLDEFKPGLRRLLYFKSKTPRETKAEQGALELEEPNDLPDLRFPELDVIKWKAEQQGRTLTLEYGLGKASNIRLTDCKANEFRLECKEGGTVKVTWRVQRSQPDERAVGKLSSLLKHEVQAMLVGSPETEALLAEQHDSGNGQDDDGEWPFETSVGAVGGVPADNASTTDMTP